MTHKMKIVVSACLAGLQCRYDGKNNLIPHIKEMVDTGLAVAVCHYFQQGKPTSEKSYSGWDAFVKANPKRTKS